MKDRLKEIRKNHNKGKTQDMFADFLGIPKQNISSYEIGRRTPSDAVIQLICEKCNVNEEWLRNGTGEMFNSIDEDAEKSYIIGQIFITLGSMSQNFTARDWTAIKDFIDMLAGKYK